MPSPWILLHRSWSRHLSTWSPTSRYHLRPPISFPCRAHRQRSETLKWKSEMATARHTQPGPDLFPARIPPLLSSQIPTLRFVLAIEQRLLHNDSNVIRIWPTALQLQMDTPWSSTTKVHPYRLPTTWVSTLSPAMTP